MSQPVKVFDLATGLLTSDPYEILNGTDFTPGSESIQCTSGSIYVIVRNTGTKAAFVNLEWSPDNFTWVTGVELIGGSSLSTVLDRIDTGPTDVDVPGLDPFSGETTEGESCAQSFKVKGKYVRLRIRLQETGTGVIGITAWMGAL